MAIRRDFMEGQRSDGQFFMAESTKPVVVFYTTEDRGDLWCQDYPGYTPELLAFIKQLREAKRAYRIFGFWPGHTRSDIFPLHEAEVIRRVTDGQPGPG